MNKLIKAIQKGLPLDSLDPYKKIAIELGVSEDEVLTSIKSLIENKTIKRFGPVLRNRQVGFNQNAMTTLKIVPEKISDLGAKISSFEFVTLCYEREAMPDVWDYNLYFMIHGKDRNVVEKQIHQVLESIKEDLLDYKILFSTRCFKQKGASY